MDGLRCCLHLRDGWIRLGGRSLDLLPLLHDEAVSDAESSSVVSVEWMIYSRSPLQTSRAHVSLGCVGVVMSRGRGD